MDLVTTVPRMSQEDFESILNSNMQVCLQNLTSRVSNIKIQEKKSYISFCKILKNVWDHAKVLGPVV